MSDRFYVNCALSVGDIELTGPEAHHLATVCRLRPGDHACLFNGDGREYPAQITSVGRHKVNLVIQQVLAPNRELGTRLQVAAPLPRGDRAQFLVEKLTELGVTSFVPLLCARSVVHPREGKLDKLRRYVIEASKQCGRTELLQVEPAEGWANYCRRGDLPPMRVLAHPGGASQERLSGKGAALAVGPEGGFSYEEVTLARQAGWRVMDLGPRILRVETAALVLATLAAY